MYEPSTYPLIAYFPTYLPIYETYFHTELVTKVKPNINSVELHPQLSNNKHPVDGVLVGAGSLWACPRLYIPKRQAQPRLVPWAAGPHFWLLKHYLHTV